jgi:hypothetical protein
MTTPTNDDDDGDGADDAAVDPVQEALALVRTMPAAAISGLFVRYGKPLALPPGPPDADTAEVTLDDGRPALVRRLRLRMPVDVIGNDWFILEVDGEDALAIPGPLFAAALAALARAVARTQNHDK